MGVFRGATRCADQRPIAVTPVRNAAMKPRSDSRTSCPQRPARDIEELRCGDAGEVGDDIAHHALIRFGMVGAQVLGQVMGSIALARGVADHDDSARLGDGLGDLFIEAVILRRPLPRSRDWSLWARWCRK